MNVFILLNCRARKSRASEWANERKREHIKVEERKKKTDTRKKAFPFDDDKRKKDRFLSLSLLHIMPDGWTIMMRFFLLLWHNSIELSRVSIRKIRIGDKKRIEWFRIRWEERREMDILKMRVSVVTYTRKKNDLYKSRKSIYFS
jgi:hypothetical protein